MLEILNYGENVFSRIKDKNKIFTESRTTNIINDHLIGISPKSISKHS